MTVVPQGRRSVPSGFAIGGDLHPLSAVVRADRHGRPVPVTHRTPTGPAVLITGGPGLGKSVELHRAAAAAQRNGRFVLQVRASRDEPLSHGIVRSLDAAAADLRSRFGARAVRRLGKRAADMLVTSRGEQRLVNAGIWSTPLLAGVTRAKHEEYAAIARTPADVVDACRELAAEHGTRLLITVDDADLASDPDLARLDQIAARLSGGEDLLIVAGRPDLVARLRSAGDRAGAGRRYDVRELEPFDDGQSEQVLAAGLWAQGIGQDRVDETAARRLIHSAGGNPRRLQRLGAEAVAVVTAGPLHRLDGAAARQVVRQVDDQDRPVFESLWATATRPERDLLTRLTQRSSLSRTGDPHVFDEARSALVTRGLVSEDPHTDELRIADPGFGRWVSVHAAVTATQAGLLPPRTSTPEAATSSHTTRPAAGRHRAIER